MHLETQKNHLLQLFSLIGLVIWELRFWTWLVWNLSPVTDKSVTTRKGICFCDRFVSFLNGATQVFLLLFTSLLGINFLGHCWLLFLLGRVDLLHCLQVIWIVKLESKNLIKTLCAHAKIPWTSKSFVYISINYKIKLVCKCICLKVCGPKKWPWLWQINYWKPHLCWNNTAKTN